MEPDSPTPRPPTSLMSLLSVGEDDEVKATSSSRSSSTSPPVGKSLSSSAGQHSSTTSSPRPSELSLSESHPASFPISPSESSSGSTAPTPRHSSYSDLPSPPIDLNRLRGMSTGASYDPRYPFPSQAPSPSEQEQESPGERSPTSPVSPISTPSPTWPDNRSYTYATTSRTALAHTQTHHHRTHHPSLSASLSHALKPRSLLSSKITRFEVALVDRLAEFLEEDNTVQAIRDATGVLSAEVTGQRGHRRFVCTGSASTVNKARQIVDARLSQTPIRIFFSIRLPSDSPYILSFAPWPSASRSNGVSRFVRSPPFTPAAPSAYRPVRPPLSTRTSTSSSRPSSFHALYANGSVGPWSTLPSSSPNATPSSERSADSFFSALSSPPCGSPVPSPSSAGTASAGSVRLLGLTDSPTNLPQVGSFEAHRAEYVQAVVEELEECVNRRSLARVKIVIGQQGWVLHDDESETAAYGMDEVEEKWKVDDSRPFCAPHFEYGMSESAVSSFVEKIKARGFAKTKETSNVHVTHLDCPRAVYNTATAAVRGHTLRSLPPGQNANGTLSLKKVSTLWSRPFSLSVSTPGTVGPPQEGSTEPSVQMKEGTDLRVKVLADKAATSPSVELSAAFSQALWAVDADGVFHVDIKLDPARFAPTQTEIRWVSKDRYENETFRAIASENRHHGTSTRTWELALFSKPLNEELAECSLNQLRKKFNRELVTKLVGELVEFAEGLVDDVHGEGRGEEERGNEEEEKEEIAAGMVATAAESPSLDVTTPREFDVTTPRQL
ncbi:hypothetical protein JCM8547_005176 [Rhodosporidiobolus lusitaniae]